jgi:hypothetical protein
MKLKIFAVRDRAIDAFGTPFFMQANGQAIRSFNNEINKGEADNQISAHPEDFDLYSLGEFETDNGSWQTTQPRQIAIGKDQKIPKENGK